MKVELGKSSACQRLVRQFGQQDFSVSSMFHFLFVPGIRVGKVKDKATGHYYHWVCGEILSHFDMHDIFIALI